MLPLVIECNDSIVRRFETWRASYPDRDIRLAHGLWQDVLDGLGQFDAVFFHTYPLNETDFIEQIAESTAAMGVDRAMLEAAERDEAAAAGVRANSEQAVADGAFGVPYFLLDGEPFWGHDRIAHIDWRLAHPIPAAE